MQEYFHTPKGMVPGKSGGWLRSIDARAEVERLETVHATANMRLEEENRSLRTALQAACDTFKPALKDAEAQRDLARTVADRLGAALEGAHRGKRERESLNQWMRERHSRREG